jgi:hypothetical protein
MTWRVPTIAAVVADERRKEKVTGGEMSAPPAPQGAGPALERVVPPGQQTPYISHTPIYSYIKTYTIISTNSTTKSIIWI